MASPTPTNCAPVVSSLPDLADRPGKCQFFVKKKHKYCTGTVHAAHGGDGYTYCSVHRLDAPPRVPCPVDPRHDVRADDVQRHVHVCPSRCAKSASPYADPGINLALNHRSGSGWNRGATTDADRVVAAATSIIGSERDCGETVVSHAKRLGLVDGAAFRNWLEGQWARVEAQVWWVKAKAHQPPLTGDLSSVFRTPCGSDREPFVGEGSQKHRLQQCLLRELLLRNLCHDFTAAASAEREFEVFDVVEVGAGKAGVACAVAKVCPSARICVVERSIYRDPKEKEVNKQLRRASDIDDEGHRAFPIERAALDAQDFSLAKFAAARRLHKSADSIPDSQNENAAATNRIRKTHACPTLGVIGKHLCGNCTDFALRVATSAVDPHVTTGKKRDRGCGGEGSEALSSPRCHVSPGIRLPDDYYAHRALVVASCCHHLTEFAEYVGNDCPLLSASQPSDRNLRSGNDGSTHPVRSTDFTPLFPSAREFCLTRSICSWALIGAAEPAQSTEHQLGTPSGYARGVVGQEGGAVHAQDCCDRWAPSVPVQDKIILGRIAKSLIDAGRVWYLSERCGWSVSYCPYADESITGERFAIVGVQRDLQG